ncbi:uncharacterized protein LOC114915299 [Cajanus cajan]|uniref:uncharacterized protein LOC114915299 n=1 Tax=Cajanus cajan TaxID=3821 RepID=UPI0010FB6CD4|nr:uncharacterized protein LOC114915299 [Cajanus cajan]
MGARRKWHGDQGREAYEEGLASFFTRFPIGFKEVELWKIFQKYGSVKEVFVAQRKNKWGREYGFVRFAGVTDAMALADQLDKIVIGNNKMHVNIPKYRRWEWRRTEHKAKTERNGGKQRHYKPNFVSNGKTYAQVLKQNGGRNQVWKEVRDGGVEKDDEQWKGYDVKVEEKNNVWLESSWVGRMLDLSLFDKIQETVVPYESRDIKLRYLGDDLVLITGLDEETIKERLHEEDGCLSMLHSIQKWSPDVAVGNRMVWVRCYGVPLQTWGVEVFSKIVSIHGSFIKLDDDTSNFHRLDYARILIQSSDSKPIHFSDTMRVNGHIRRVSIIEEFGAQVATCHCWKWENNYNLLISWMRNEKQSPTVGLEPTTTRLRALRSTN